MSEYIWLRNGKFWKSSRDYEGKKLIKEILINGIEKYYIDYGCYIENGVLKMENPYYYGSLYLNNTPITNLGNLKSVNGSLFLENTPITSLGNLENVGAYIYVDRDKVDFFKNKYPQFEFR